MNALLGFLREIALGGVVVLVLYIVLKGEIPSGYALALFASPVLYLLFVFFTYLKAKSFTEKFNDQYGVEIPSNGYGKTLLRSFPIDIFSPIGSIIGLFKDQSNKVLVFILTYVVVAGYVALWFFVLK